MDEFIPIVTALIALVGTIIGIAFGYKKWRKEQTSKRYNQFEIDKQNAYKELWEQVEDFNIKVRLEEVTSEDFTKHLQNLNAFLLKNGLYINDKDRMLANEYADAVYKFQKIVKDSEDNEAKVPLGKTQDIPQSVIEKAKEIGQAQEYALELRKQLIKKIKIILSGEKN